MSTETEKRWKFTIKPTSIVGESILWSTEHNGTRGVNVQLPTPFATRIVACVNACEGISNSALDSGAVKELVEAAKWEMSKTKDVDWKQLLEDLLYVRSNFESGNDDEAQERLNHIITEVEISAQNSAEKRSRPND